jgi:hypothetical protein
MKCLLAWITPMAILGVIVVALSVGVLGEALAVSLDIQLTVAFPFVAGERAAPGSRRRA